MSKHIGFCLNCQQNKEHEVKEGFFWAVNACTFGVSGKLGLNTWQCIHCQSSTAFIRSRRTKKKASVEERSTESTASASSTALIRAPKTPQRSSTLPPPPPNGGLKRRRTTDASKQSDDAIAIKTATPSGNYIQGDQSLIVRSLRSKQYSEKYRDGVVTRILSGKTSISNVRESLNLTEHDVIDWIKQCMDRKTNRIDELKMQIKELEQSGHSSKPVKKLGLNGPSENNATQGSGENKTVHALGVDSLSSTNAPW